MLEKNLVWNGGSELENGVELCGHKMGVIFDRICVIWVCDEK